jgi:hypothetical protein
MTKQYINQQLNNAKELIDSGSAAQAKEIISKLILDLQAEKPVGLKN